MKRRCVEKIRIGERNDYFENHVKRVSGHNDDSRYLCRFEKIFLMLPWNKWGMVTVLLVMRNARAHVEARADVKFG